MREVGVLLGSSFSIWVPFWIIWSRERDDFLYAVCPRHNTLGLGVLVVRWPSIPACMGCSYSNCRLLVQ
jgi:hypothetical protein